MQIAADMDTTIPPQTQKRWSEAEVAKYGGEDGVIDAIEEVMMKYDKDKNGTFSIAEVKAIVADLQAKNKQVKNLKKALVVGFLIAVVVCAVLFSMMFASNEAAKENHTKDGMMVDLNNEPVQVDSVVSAAHLWDLPRVPLEYFKTMEALSIFIDVSNHPSLPAGKYESSFKISSASKLTDDVIYLRTYEGYMINIDRASKTGAIDMDGHKFPIYDESKKRRLSGTSPHSVCSDGDDVCFPRRLWGGATALSDSVDENGRRLGRGRFLAATGSFRLSGLVPRRRI